MKKKKSQNLLQVEKTFRLRQNSISTEKSFRQTNTLKYTTIQYFKKPTKAHFSLLRKQNESNNQIEDSFEKKTVPNKELNLQVKLIKDAKDMNSEFKPQKALRTRSHISKRLKTKNVPIKKTFQYFEGVNIHNQVLSPPAKSIVTNPIQDKLIVLRLHMLNTFHILEAMKTSRSREVQTSQTNFRYVDRLDEDFKTKQMFQENIMYNVNSIIKSLMQNNTKIEKRPVFKEAKSNEFFYEILDKILRKVMYIKERNQMIGVDTVLNLISDEVQVIRANIEAEENINTSKIETEDSRKTSEHFFINAKGLDSKEKEKEIKLKGRSVLKVENFETNNAEKRFQEIPTKPKEVVSPFKDSSNVTTFNSTRENYYKRKGANSKMTTALRKQTTRTEEVDDKLKNENSPFKAKSKNNSPTKKSNHDNSTSKRKIELPPLNVSKNSSKIQKEEAKDHVLNLKSENKQFPKDNKIENNSKDLLSTRFTNEYTSNLTIPTVSDADTKEIIRNDDGKVGKNSALSRNLLKSTTIKQKLSVKATELSKSKEGNLNESQTSYKSNNKSPKPSPFKKLDAKANELMELKLNHLKSHKPDSSNNALIDGENKEKDEAFVRQAFKRQFTTIVRQDTVNLKEHIQGQFERLTKKNSSQIAKGNNFQRQMTRRFHEKKSSKKIGENEEEKSSIEPVKLTLDINKDSAYYKQYENFIRNSSKVAIEPPKTKRKTIVDDFDSDKFISQLNYKDGQTDDLKIMSSNKNIELVSEPNSESFYKKPSNSNFRNTIRFNENPLSAAANSSSGSSLSNAKVDEKLLRSIREDNSSAASKENRNSSYQQRNMIMDRLRRQSQIGNNLILNQVFKSDQDKNLLETHMQKIEEETHYEKQDLELNDKLRKAKELMLLDLNQDIFYHIKQHEITDEDNRRYEEILESLSFMKIDMKGLVENIENDFKIIKDEIGNVVETKKIENRINEFLYNLKDYRVKKQKYSEFIQTKMKVIDNRPKNKLAPILDKEEFSKKKLTK